MSVPEINMSPIQFPGQIARLEVDIQTDFDPQDSLFLTKIWRFCNQIENPESLINRVEVWQDRTGITLVQVFFNKLGCEQMKQAFADKMDVEFFHCHQYNWCQLEVKKREEMQRLLTLIDSTHEFFGESQTELKSIISKLSA